MSLGSAATTTTDTLLRRQRRELVRANPHLTGLDWVEFVAADASRCRVVLHFVAKPGAVPHDLHARDILAWRLPDGVPVAALAVGRDGGDVHALTADFPASLGDAGSGSGQARLVLRGDAAVDPLLASADFMLDRQATVAIDPQAAVLPADAAPVVDVNYLAKDYQSFLRSMLDRMTARLPEWQERHAADMGVALIELLAYAADDLSYRQDAVATEAYLGTARLRTSVRRHARLLDYPLHEGCAARVLLHLDPDENGRLPAGAVFIGSEDGESTERTLRVAAVGGPLPDGVVIFESLTDVELHVEHSRIALYDWGVEEFSLAAGSTSATLAGWLTELRAGDLLILASISPLEDDRSLRHPVRLRHPPRHRTDPATGVDVTDIEWFTEDALPFILPVRTSGVAEPLAVVWGNLVPADLGLSVTEQHPSATTPTFLRRANLVHAVPYDAEAEAGRPAASFHHISPLDAVPAIRFQEDGAAEPWLPRPDLLSSDRYARDFVVECEADGSTRLRFGDGGHGRQPTPGTTMTAYYRVGPGDHNVAADSIGQWMPRLGDPVLRAVVTNPLNARGGQPAQALAEARREAPLQLTLQRRCVVAADYIAAATADARIKAAVAERRWTGSWRTLIVHVQPADGRQADADLLASLTDRLERLCILGEDVVVRPPRYIPVLLELSITAAPRHPADRLRRQVVDALAALTRPGRLSFGEPVLLSPLIAVAMAVSGVVDAAVVRLERLGHPPAGELAAGRLTVGPTEIARLDNLPQAPERGQILVKVMTP